MESIVALDSSVAQCIDSGKAADIIVLRRSSRALQGLGTDYWFSRGDNCKVMDHSCGIRLLRPPGVCCCQNSIETTKAIALSPK